MFLDLPPICILDLLLQNPIKQYNNYLNFTETSLDTHTTFRHKPGIYMPCLFVQVIERVARRPWNLHEMPRVDRVEFIPDCQLLRHKPDWT